MKEGFYHTYLFSQKDRNRAELSWRFDHSVMIRLLFRPMYTQIASDGFVYHYKTLGEAYYLFGCERFLAQRK